MMGTNVDLKHIEYLKTYFEDEEAFKKQITDDMRSSDNLMRILRSFSAQVTIT